MPTDEDRVYKAMCCLGERPDERRVVLVQREGGLDDLIGMDLCPGCAARLLRRTAERLEALGQDCGSHRRGMN
jgi:hypothetical protein